MRQKQRFLAKNSTILGWRKNKRGAVCVEIQSQAGILKLNTKPI
jgi:hypothetical protein